MPDNGIDMNLRNKLRSLYDTYAKEHHFFSMLKVVKSFQLKKEDRDRVLMAWLEEHRHWHSFENHLHPLLQDIHEAWRDPEVKAEVEEELQKRQITESGRDLLVIVALFHDVVFDPRHSDHEKASARVFEKIFAGRDEEPWFALVRDTILETELEVLPSSALAKVFNRLDARVLFSGTVFELLAYERLIAKEYQFVGYQVYQEGRLEFLRNWLSHHSENQANLEYLVQFVKHRELKVGLYAGTFNPYHIGHYNIVKKAEKIFDKVIIGVGVNPEKDESMQENVTERMKQVKDSSPFHEVVQYTGFLTDFIRSLPNFENICLIRGLRSSFDLNYETTQLRLMQDQYPGLNVVYLLCDYGYEHISSSSVRMLEDIEEGSSGKYLVWPEIIFPTDER